MKILEKLTSFKNNLTHIGKKEPIHFLSFFVLIALDIFVLSNIFIGLDMQTQQMNAPHEVVPYQCKNLLSEYNTQNEKIYFIENSLNTNFYYDDTVQNKYASAVDIIEENNKNKIHPKCLEVFYDVKDLNKIFLNTKLLEIQNLELANNQLSTKNYKNTREYDTMLLEDIAHQKEEYSITALDSKTIKKDIEKNKQIISKNNKKIDILKKEILSDSSVINLFTTIKNNKEEILSDLEKLEFWFPLEKWGAQMIFLIPLVILFFVLFSGNFSNKYPIAKLLFSHLFVVTLIPLFSKIFFVLLDVLPFHFFSDLLDLLEALNLIAIFSYVLIFIGIIITLSIVYFFQRKLFSPENTWRKRLAKNQCWSCGTQKIMGFEKEKYCTFCGEEQCEKCEKCEYQKIKKSEFCNNCGK